MQKKINLGSVSAVETHTLTASSPFEFSQVMGEVVLGAGSGTVSLTFSGSNDGTNYTAIGSAITATNRAVALSTGGLNFQFYRAVVVISTNTKVTDVALYFV
jgi:hypothetical protein